MPCKCTEHDHVPSASNEAVHYHAKSERSTLGMLMPPIVRVWTLFSFFSQSSLLFFFTKRSLLKPANVFPHAVLEMDSIIVSARRRILLRVVVGQP